MMQERFTGIHFHFFLFSILCLPLSVLAEDPSTSWTASPFESKVFIENKGQFDGKNNLPGSHIYYGIDNLGFQVYFTPKGLSYRLDKMGITEEKEKKRLAIKAAERAGQTIDIDPKERAKLKQCELLDSTLIHLEWIGVNQNVQIVSEDPVDEYFNYGSTDLQEAINFVKAYQKLTYKNIYPGIDLVYNFHPKEGIKYFFLLAPGADPSLIKMKYSGNSMVSMDDKGNIHLSTIYGDIIDHAPETFYVSSAGKDDPNIASSFVLKDNVVSFDFPQGYDVSRPVIIDPWVRNPKFPTKNKAFDIERDQAGNVYIYGGVTPFRLKKYNAAGVQQWNYIGNALDDNSWVGDLATDYSGNCFISNGLPGGSAIKVSNMGVELVLNKYFNSGMELFNMVFNSSRTKLISSTMSSNSYVGEMDQNSLDMLSWKNLNINFEIRGLVFSPNGNYYAITVSDNNENWTGRCFGFDSNFNVLWNTSSDYAPANYGYHPTNYHLGGSPSSIAASYCYVYTYNGDTLRKRDINSGALISSIKVAGSSLNDCYGIVVDHCDNVYVGTMNGISMYDVNLNFVTSTPTAGAVYDIAFGLGRNIIATGDSMVSLISDFVPYGCTFDSMIVSASSSDETCTGNNGLASFTSVTNGMTPYTYSWSNGQTSSSISGLSAGVYTGTVLDAACHPKVYTTTLTITDHPTGIPSLGPVQNVDCNGNTTGSATVNIAGGGGSYNYLWNNTQTSATATGLAAGIYSVSVTDANNCIATQTVSITEPSLLSITSSTVTDVFCYGEANGEGLITHNNGGIGPYTYLWSNSQTSLSATGLAAGIYSVSVTDVSNCVATQTVTIIEPSLLAIISQTLTNVSCNSANDGTGSITHNNGGTGPYTYLWTNGSGASTANGLSPGTHTVTVTDKNGCIASASVSITEPLPLATGTLSVAANCNQSDGSATVNTNDGTAPYSYLWSTGQTSTGITSILNTVAQGIYSCTVSDANGCSTLAVVSVDNLNGVSLQSSNTNPALCFNSCDGNGSVTGVGGTAPYNYVWSNGQMGTGASSMATGLCAGLYTCTVTDDKGCRDEISITISQPFVLSTSLSALPASCFGENSGTASVQASGGTTDYTYQWNTNPVQVTNTAINIPAGNYQVTVTDGNGCSMTSTIITVSEPLELVATITGPASVCSMENANLSVSAIGGTTNYNYLWNTGQATSAISHSPASSTIYSSTVTDANGCTSVSTYSLLVNPLPEVSAEFSDSSGCPQLCVDFNNTSQNITSLAWNFGDGATSSANTLQHCYNTPGTYGISLTVTDNNGCSNTLVKNNFMNVFSIPLADFIATPSITTVLNGSIQFMDKSQGAVAWDWNFGDVLNSNSIIQHPKFTYSDSGDYVVRLIVTNDYGCMDSTERLVKIRPEFALYIPNSFTPNGDFINDEFIPQGIGINPNEYEILIFDRWGNQIWKSKVWGKGWNGKANGGSSIAQQDVYVWKINCRDTEGTKRQFMGHVNLVR